MDDFLLESQRLSKCVVRVNLLMVQFLIDMMGLAHEARRRSNNKILPTASESVEMGLTRAYPI